MLTGLNDACPLQDKLADLKIDIFQHLTRVLPDTEDGMSAAREHCMAYAIVQVTEAHYARFRLKYNIALQAHTELLTQLLTSGLSSDDADCSQQLNLLKCAKDEARAGMEAGTNHSFKF